MSALFAELELARQLAIEAGELLLRYFKRSDLQVEQKTADEPVSEADHAAQALILTGLERAFPEDGILAEERADTSAWASKRRAWMVDPIDGTKDFIAGRDGFSVMIGLLIDDRPLLGVVHQPTNQLTYSAISGAGAFYTLGDDPRARPLEPSMSADLETLRLVSSYSHRNPTIDKLRDHLGCEDELRVGSVGLKIGLIARGLRDLYVNPAGHCRLWDVCAPQAILQEAGGTITDLAGNALAFARGSDVRVKNGIVASNGRCHQQVLDKLAPLISS